MVGWLSCVVCGGAAAAGNRCRCAAAALYLTPSANKQNDAAPQQNDPATKQHSRTLGAALVKLSAGLVEQGIHCKGQIELLDVEGLQAGLQRGLWVQFVCAAPPPGCLLAVAAHAAVAQVAGCGAVWLGMSD